MRLYKVNDFISLMEKEYDYNTKSLKNYLFLLGIRDSELKMLTTIISATPVDFLGELSADTMEYVADVKISQIVDLYQDKFANHLNEAYSLAKQLLEYSFLTFALEKCKKYGRGWDYIVDYNESFSFDIFSHIELYGVKELESEDNWKYEIVEGFESEDNLLDERFGLVKIFASPYACVVEHELKNTDVHAIETLSFLHDELK